MSSRDGTRRLKLPKQLLDQLGVGDEASHKKSSTKAPSRKDSRKLARVDKRTRADQARLIRKQTVSWSSLSKTPRSHTVPHPKQYSQDADDGDDSLVPSDEADDIDGSSGDESFESLVVDRAPETEKPKVSRSVQARLDEDDQEIKRLEKKLGLKNKKRQRGSLDDDGLEGLLEGLQDDGPDGSNSPEDIEAQAWLQRKRQAPKQHTMHTHDHSDLSDFSGFSDSRSRDEKHDTSASEALESSDGDTAKPKSKMHSQERKRENPYRPPVTDSSTPSSTSRRQLTQSVSQDEIAPEIKRKIKGLLNRLSEGNILSILTDIEGLYLGNPRQHVTSALIDALLSQFERETALEDTFIILHGGFIAGITKVMGADFGAEAVKHITEQLQGRLEQPSGEGSADKKAINLMALLCELYNFRVISSDLVYDFVRVFVNQMSEQNTELLLKVVKACGPQLRQEDPGSLKEIIVQLQSSVSAIGLQNLTIRTRFMVDTIMDLKNNRLKVTLQTSGVPHEHRNRLRKSLGAVSQHKVKTNEPLRITLADIQNSASVGRWWVVGAMYTDQKPKQPLTKGIYDAKTEENALDGGIVDITALAKAQRMNTEVRRSIFVSIMSASDYQDAHHRLLKLSLKRSQEVEIPKVLIQCVTGEQVYNPYYSVIAGQLCTDKRMKMAFQFALWDALKAILEDEAEDMPVDSEQSLDIKPIVHLGKFYGHIVADKRLDITIAKNIDVESLEAGDVYHVFLEIFLVTIILQCHRRKKTKNAHQTLFEVFSAATEVADFAHGLQMFLDSTVVHTDLIGDKSERRVVRASCKAIMAHLNESMMDLDN